MEKIRIYYVEGSELDLVWCIFRIKTFKREVLLPGRSVIPKTYASMFIPGHMHKIRYYINCNIPICWEYKYLAIDLYFSKYIPKVVGGAENLDNWKINDWV